MQQLLEELFNKRTGGSVNFRGIQFQLYYACYRLLNAWRSECGPERIVLEGIEDVDIHFCGLQSGNREYVQIKTSQNKLSAADFWEVKVIQNFFQAYLVDADATFLVAYNAEIAKSGYLSDWIKKGKIDDYWIQKLRDLFPHHDETLIRTFLQHIVFERHSVQALRESCENALLDKFGVGAGTVDQFFYTLVYHSIEWSKSRSSVLREDLYAVVQNTKDALSKHVVNPAVRHNWISQVKYEPVSDADLSYYDGTAARPSHIVQNLPARRKEWEKTIEQTLAVSDVVVIKSSSGQGKSTLAWQVGQNLMTKGKVVFQLQQCQGQNEAAAIAEFLEGKVKSGCFPVVVIDGLDQRKSDWFRLSEMVCDLPVKFIVTSRHEDWYHYGADLSRVNLKIVELKLAMNEAMYVYHQLRSKGKVHPTVKTWQEPWERVSEKGLLIEYVYLVTQGDMLKSRLEYQVQKMAGDRDAGALLEILRLVSVSDCLDIKLKTKELTKLVAETISFQSDRGEVFKRLEKEYHLKYDAERIEGCHPVRSEHLASILHEYVSISETLKKVFSILDPQYHQQFFGRFHKVLTRRDDALVLEHFGAMVSSRTFSEMVGAINGLFLAEAERYGQENKHVLDEAFQRSGLSLFVLDTLDFSTNNFLKELRSVISSRPEYRQNVDTLIQLKEKLSPLNWKETRLYCFAEHLNRHLASIINVENIQGLSRLDHWFEVLGLKMNLRVTCDYDKALEEMKNDLIAVEDIRELFYQGRKWQPSEHENFISEHQGVIISWLNLRTKSYLIRETDEGILIEYPLQESYADGNLQSVERIEIVHSVLPGFEKYMTRGYLFPFPNEKIFEVAVQNSVKHMMPENIPHPHAPLINQLWSRTLELPYHCHSSFDWQQENLAFRTSALDFVKSCILLFEAHIEGNREKLERVLYKTVDLTNNLTQSFAVRRKVPVFYVGIGESRSKMSEKRVSDWATSVANFARQYSGLFNRNGQSAAEAARVPLFNLKEANERLKEMQQEYSANLQRTYAYFPADELDQKETEYTIRLIRTVEFFIRQQDNGKSGIVLNARKEVAQWAQETMKGRLNRVRTILTDSAAGKPYSIILPSKLLEDGNFITANVALRDFNSDDPETFLELSISLLPLLETDVQYFHLIFLKKGDVASHAVRVSRDYFLSIQEFAQGIVPERFDTIPFPIELNQELLFGLDGIVIGAFETKSGGELYHMIRIVWSFLERKARCNPINDIDEMYFRREEAAFFSEFESRRRALEEFMPVQAIGELISFLKDILDNPPADYTNTLVAALNLLLSETVLAESGSDDRIFSE